MNSLPFSNLHRITILMTIMINLFIGSILVFSGTETPVVMITNILKCAAIVYLLRLGNMLALYCMETEFGQRFKSRHWIKDALSAAIGIAVFSMLSIIFSYFEGGARDFVDQKTKITTIILVFTVFHTLTVVLQDQVILLHNKGKAELENMQLKAAVTEASNFMLRQQIHPHFLFNSLTILKSLYKKDAVKGEFYLTRLASFLRASISEHASKITTLQTELTLCMDYMEMQKIRFGNAIEYNVAVSEEAKVNFVPFFSIQVLLENAIKHNAMTTEKPLIINVSDHEGYLTVENNYQPKTIKEISTGLGLANLAERYMLLSGDLIDVKENPEQFSVTIKLYENEDSNH